MSAPKKCTRCGMAVPEILSGPPDARNMWWRNRVQMREVAHTLRFSIFKRQWLPADPFDQVAETYTNLDLCDDCAADVYLYAQGLPPRVRTNSLAATAAADAGGHVQADSEGTA